MTKEQAVNELREILPSGSVVYNVLRDVSECGMTRHIECLHVAGGEICNNTHLIGKALGYRRHDDGGLVVQGSGMDMGFHLVSTLSWVLHGDAYAIKSRWI